MSFSQGLPVPPGEAPPGSHRPWAGRSTTPILIVVVAIVLGLAALLASGFRV